MIQSSTLKAGVWKLRRHRQIPSMFRVCSELVFRLHNVSLIGSPLDTGDCSSKPSTFILVYLQMYLVHDESRVQCGDVQQLIPRIGESFGVH